MYYNRSGNPDTPEWVAKRGSSRIEGGHKYYHDSLPGNNYSADLADTIFALRMGESSIRAAHKNCGHAAVSLADAYQQHEKQQLVDKHGWQYNVPASIAVQPTTEVFGAHFVAGTRAIEQARHEMRTARVQVSELIQEEDMLLEDAELSACLPGRNYA